MREAQRRAGNAAVSQALKRQDAAPPAAAAAPAPAVTPASAALIVEDAAENVGPAQMRRSAFIAELRAAVTAGAREVLAGSPQEALIETTVDERLAPYRAKDAAALELAIRAEVPAARGAVDARSMIVAVSVQVKASLQQQLAEQARSGALGAIGSAVKAVTGAVSSAVSGAIDAAGGALSSLASALFKRGPGSGTGAIANLGRSFSSGGQPLEGDVRGRMETALGADFTGVRVHSSPVAADAVQSLGSLAVTVGDDVAFAPGQYRPGNPVGDALLAHELAHVVQQRGGVGTTLQESALEADADASAASAVSELWDSSGSRRGIRRLPRLQSPIGLRSCAPAKSAPTDPHGRYEFYLEDGAKRLGSAGFGTPLGPDFVDHFDKQYWEWDADPVYSRLLRVKAGKRPSAAVDALFDNLDKWKVDCDHLIQLAHIWAQRNTFPDQFDRTFPTIELRPRGSTGVKSRVHYGRNSPGGSWFEAEPLKPGEAWLKLTPQAVNKNTDQLVAEAPVGSRVRWTNLKADTSDAFRHENSLKLGPDRFAAAGFTRGTLERGDKNIFSASELAERLGKNQNPDANASYIAANVFIDEIEHMDTP